MFQQLAALVVLKQPRRPANKEVSLKNRRPGKCCRSADPGKRTVSRSLELDYGKTVLPLRLQLLPRRLERVGRLPIDQDGSRRPDGQQDQRGKQGHAPRSLAQIVLDCFGESKKRSGNPTPDFSDFLAAAGHGSVSDETEQTSRRI